jgi:hypothetical protein
VLTFTLGIDKPIALGSVEVFSGSGGDCFGGVLGFGGGGGGFRSILFTLDSGGVVFNSTRMLSF